jgi:hypothetical protein
MRIFIRNPIPLLVLAAVLFGLNFLNFHIITKDEFRHDWERDNSTLINTIRSVDDLLNYADSVAVVKNIGKGSLEYAIELDNVVKNRFTHGYSHYGFKENWIAATAGSVWKNFSAIVTPDDLLKYPQGACSQQSIVLMECMKRRGISYRTVYFSSHFALEAKVGNQWFFFDPDMEPSLTLATITNLDSLSKSEKLYTIYKLYSDSVSLATTLSSFSYGKVNAKQAPKTVYFHSVTKFLSKTLWLIPLIAAIFIYRKRRISKERSRIKSAGSPLYKIVVNTNIESSVAR